MYLQSLKDQPGCDEHPGQRTAAYNRLDWAKEHLGRSVSSDRPMEVENPHKPL